MDLIHIDIIIDVMAMYFNMFSLFFVVFKYFVVFRMDNETVRGLT